MSALADGKIYLLTFITILLHLILTLSVTSCKCMLFEHDPYENHVRRAPNKGNLSIHSHDIHDFLSIVAAT